jgi:Lysine-specific metallo-endopeptidase
MFKVVFVRTFIACTLLAPLLALAVVAPARAVVLTTFTNCSPGEGVAIRAALQNAANPSTQSQAYVNGLPGAGNPALFQRWFGRVAASATVAGVYAHVVTLIGNNTNMEVFCGVARNINGNNFTACGNEFAASMYQVMALQICPNFFNQPNTGLDSRAGIIIHEFTHITDNTEDHAYGCAAARNGALAPPYQRYNADNYEYMAEEGFMAANCP